MHQGFGAIAQPKVKRVHSPVGKFDQLNAGIAEALFDVGKNGWVRVFLSGLEGMGKDRPGRPQDRVVKNEDSAGQGHGNHDKTDEQAQPTMQQPQDLHANGVVSPQPPGT